MFKSKRKEPDLRVGWIGVDLDGTLVHGDDLGNPEFVPAPIPVMCQRVKQWLYEGSDVRIFTARVAPLFSPNAPKQERIQAEKAMRAIEDWCEVHFGKRLRVTAVKDLDMQILYDDRCITVEKNTGRLIIDVGPEQMQGGNETDVPNLEKPRRDVPVTPRGGKSLPSAKSGKVELPAQDFEHARQFAEWQQNARKRKGWHIRRLVEESGFSETQVRLFDADGHAGLDATGRYRRPSKEYIETVARVTNADFEAGLIAAGKVARDYSQAKTSHSVPKEMLLLSNTEDIEFYANYCDMEPDHKDILKMIAEKLIKAEGKKNIALVK